MGKQHEQHPAQTAEHHGAREIRLEKLCRLAAVGLAHKQQHRGGYRRVELHEAIDVDKHYHVKEYVDKTLQPLGHAARQEPQHNADYAHIEEQLVGRKRPCVISALVGHYGISAHDAEHIHEYKESGIAFYRLEDIGEHTSCQIQYFHQILNIFGKITSFYCICNANAPQIECGKDKSHIFYYI